MVSVIEGIGKMEIFEKTLTKAVKILGKKEKNYRKVVNEVKMMS